MVIMWMCLCIFLLLIEFLSMLNTVELVVFWHDEGVKRMAGFAGTYIKIYNYKNGAGKEFAGNLKLPNSAENLSTYERFEIDKAFLVPFWVIGGFQFLHLLYACTISIELVCNNKAGPIGAGLKPEQEGLEVTESSSKNVPAIATIPGDFANLAFGTLFGQQNAKDNINIGAKNMEFYRKNFKYRTCNIYLYTLV
jgi:hypothetical protein